MLKHNDSLQMGGFMVIMAVPHTLNALIAYPKKINALKEGASIFLAGLCIMASSPIQHLRSKVEWMVTLKKWNQMKTESYSTGDMLHITPFYTSIYPNWKGKKGEVISSRLRVVKDEHLQGTERAFLRGRYGTQTRYPIFEILLKIDDQIHLVSQFGFNKD